MSYSASALVVGKPAERRPSRIGERMTKPTLVVPSWPGQSPHQLLDESHAGHRRFARVMTQPNGALPLGQWGRSGVSRLFRNVPIVNFLEVSPFCNVVF